MYLEKAFHGKNNVWRYLLVLFILIVVSMVTGQLPLLAVIVIKVFQGMPLEDLDAFRTSIDFSYLDLHPAAGLILICLPFAITLGVLVLLYREIHGKKIKDLFTASSSFRWKRVLLGGGLWFALAVLTEIAGFILDPENYSFTFRPRLFFPTLLAALVFLPLQTSMEEAVFRGYLSQALTLLTKRRWAAVLLVALIFSALHIPNPEIRNYGLGWMLPHYLIIALLLGVVTVMDGGLELALGIHAVNNIYGVAVVNVKGTALQMPALFTSEEFDPRFTGLFTLVFAVLFCLALKKICRWGSWRELFLSVHPPGKSDGESV
jgi:membrane protease YdiL (CAAX protease family)